MTLYAALLYYPEGRYWLDPDEAPTAPGYAEFFEAANAQGVLRGGEALRPAAEAATVTVRDGKGGELTITDGPFAETKEVLGGFYLIEAESRDEAARWAAMIPAAWRGKVEIRPVVPMQNRVSR
jgi:hypothetical protein